MSALDYLSWLSTDGKVTRREFMKRATALGVSGVLATSVAGKGAFADDTPKKGGHLILGLDGSATTDTLDPTTYVVAWQYTLGHQWGNTLTELTEGGEILPDLAESWEPDSTATTWVFKLRKGVEFHNGKEFTSDDVLYTLDYHRNENSTSPAKPFFKPVTEIKATGKHEVTMTLESPNADWPYIFTDYHLLMMPDQGDPNAGIGTGGYVLKSFEPGSRATTERNPNYFKENAAFVDSIETVGINDLAARTSALQSGAVHFINRVDPKTVRLIEQAGNLKIVDVPSGGFYCFPMRCDTPPFDDKDMRLAMKYALNREQLIQKILGGYGVPANDHPISPLDRFYAADIPQHTYDPEKAKFHYGKSGHSGAVELQISEAAFPGAVDAAALYKEDARQAGITIDIKRVPDDGYWSEVWLNAPFCGSYWAGRPTPDMMLSLGFQSTAAWNESFWKREDFDALLLQARGELDFDKRKEMYRELQFMISDDSGDIIPMFNNYLFASAQDVAGLRPTANFVGYRIGEQLYFTG